MHAARHAEFYGEWLQFQNPCVHFTPCTLRFFTSPLTEKQIDVVARSYIKGRDWEGKKCVASECENKIDLMTRFNKSLNARRAVKKCEITKCSIDQMQADVSINKYLSLSSARAPPGRGALQKKLRAAGRRLLAGLSGKKFIYRSALWLIYDATAPSVITQACSAAK